MSYNRNNYLNAVKSQLEQNIFRHSLALEACMGGLYDYFSGQNLLGGNEPPKEDWLLAGLVHDIDFSGDFKPTHPQKTKEALEKYGLSISPSVHEIVKSHAPDLTGVKPLSKAQWSIFCADSLTGLITAVALILPSKKLGDVKIKSVMKRFLKEPRFAAGTRRDEVAMCSNPEGLNMEIEKFIEICLSSMQKIAPDLGL